MKQKIILDCDPGIDDALAILFAMGLDDLELLAVTTVSGNRPVDQTFDNARRIVALGGRAEIPVYRGAYSPLDQTEPRSNLVHGADGLGGIVLPDTPAPAEELPAALKILDVLRGHPEGEVTLVAIGPLTNLALAYALDPVTFKRAGRLAIMGGSIHHPGNVTTVAEFNVWADPLAADRVLQSGVPIELFGLDVTSQAICTQPWLADVAALPGPVGAPLAKMVEAYFAEDPLLHDPCPLAWLVAPDLFQASPFCVRADTTAGYGRGKTIGWPKGRPDAPGPINVQAHLAVDCDGLLDLMLKSLKRLSHGMSK